MAFDVDLDEVSLRDASAFLGPLLARTALHLAAADVPLAERMLAWPRIAAADPPLHDRLLASHLTAHPPVASTDTADAETV